MFVRRMIIAGAAALALGAGLSAAPAFASDNPVNVSAVVTSSTTISGLTDVTFPSTPAGQTASAPAAETYTVATNNLAGYSLRAVAGASSFTNGGSGTISDSNWSITETGMAPQTFSPAASGTMIATTSAPSTDTYHEDWSLKIPASAPAGSYTNTLDYVLVAN